MEHLENLENPFSLPLAITETFSYLGFTQVGKKTPNLGSHSNNDGSNFSNSSHTEAAPLFIIMYHVFKEKHTCSFTLIFFTKTSIAPPPALPPLSVNREADVCMLVV